MRYQSVALFPTNARTERGDVVFTRVHFFKQKSGKGFAKTSYCTIDGNYLSKSERLKLPPISEF